VSISSAQILVSESTPHYKEPGFLKERLIPELGQGKYKVSRKTGYAGSKTCSYNDGDK
jgi:hypothetical protein